VEAIFSVEQLRPIRQSRVGFLTGDVRALSQKAATPVLPAGNVKVKIAGRETEQVGVARKLPTLIISTAITISLFINFFSDA
jgi:hypothetical protein